MSRKKHEWTRKGVTASMAVVLAFGMAPAVPGVALATAGKDSEGIEEPIDSSNAAPGEVAGQTTLGQEGAIDYNEESTIKIESSKDLVDAIKNQQDGQTWVFKEAGTYDLNPAQLTESEAYGDQFYKQDEDRGFLPENSIVIGDHDYSNDSTGFVCPIYVDNLTICKDGNVDGEVVITSSAVPSKSDGGNWPRQNFITITGDNVTIRGVSIKANANAYYDNTCNKVIEILSDKFEADGVKFLNVSDEKKFSGTLYVNKIGVTTTVKNSVFEYGRISLSGADPTNTFEIDNVELDFANAYNEDYYAFYNPNNASAEATNLTVTATPKCLDYETNSMGEMLGMLPEGATVQLLPGNYNLVPGEETVSGQAGWYMPIVKSVTLQGVDDSGNVITDPAEAKANIYSTDYLPNGAWASQNLITVFADDVTIEGMAIMNKVQPNKGIEIVGPVENFTLRNCKLTPISKNLWDEELDNIEGNSYTFECIEDYGSSVYFNGGNNTENNIIATITGNLFDRSSVSFGSVAGGSYSLTGNTFTGVRTLHWTDEKDYTYGSVGYTGKWTNPEGDSMGEAILDIKKNKFLNCGKINFSGIVDDTTPNLSHNYWGSDNPDFGALITGEVNYAPYYKAESMRDPYDLSNYIPPAPPAGGGSSVVEGEVVENPDGSTTTTVTEESQNADGSATTTVTETTEGREDGSTTEKVTETTVSADGSKAEKVTETNTLADGTSATTVTVDGALASAEATVTEQAVEAAAGKAVALPMAPVEAKASGEAVAIEVSAPAGAKVAVPVAKAEGSESVAPGAVIVLVDEEGNETALPKTANTGDALSSQIPGDCTLKVVDASADFPDVASEDWYAEQGVADFVSARGIMTGVEVGPGSFEFQGDAPTNRGMFVTMLHRLESEPAVASEGFADVDPDSWFAGSSAWAVEAGIATGYLDEEGNAAFEGDGAVTREQMATFLYRYAQWLGMDTSARADVSGVEGVSDWAKEALSWAVAEGLIKGDDDTGAIRPADGATRAEAAVVVMRMIGLMA